MAATSTWIAGRPTRKCCPASWSTQRRQLGHRIRRRRRPRDLRRSSRRNRQRRRGPAALRASAAERAPPRRPDGRGDRDEQHRAGAGAPRSRDRARAYGCRGQICHGGDAGARRLARGRTVGPRHLLGLPLYGRRALHGAERVADDGADGPIARGSCCRSRQLSSGVAQRPRAREGRPEDRAGSGKGHRTRGIARRRAGARARPVLRHRAAAAGHARRTQPGRHSSLGAGDHRCRESALRR